MNAIAKKKLSAATILGDVKKMVAKGELKSGDLLYRAIGVADGVRTGTSTYGEWVAFTGVFKVINGQTGEIFEGAQFFPDRAFTDVLQRKLDANPGVEVEFALEVLVDVDDKYPTGYSYVTRPILNDSVNRLAALEERLSALPALEAPKKAAKK